MLQGGWPIQEWGGRILNFPPTPYFDTKKRFWCLKWLVFAFLIEVFICSLYAMLLYCYFKQWLYYFIMCYYVICFRALYVCYIVLELNWYIYINIVSLSYYLRLYVRLRGIIYFTVGMCKNFIVRWCSSSDLCVVHRFY